MQRPILLVGASGQLGRELQTALASLGTVIPTVRSLWPGSATPHAARPLWPGSATPEESQQDIGSVASAGAIALDLTNVDKLRHVVSQIQPRLIVNAAAHTDVDRAENEVAMAHAVNCFAAGALAEEAARVGAALVHYSTDYVFSGSGARAWREDDSAAPLNAYGRSKLAGEQAIRSAGAAHLILRTAWVYSPHGRNFVTTMLRKGLEVDELRVVSDQIGAPTSARRIADVTTRILAMAGDDPLGFFKQRGGTIHACAAGEAARSDVAVELFRLARAAGLPLRVRQVVPVTSAEYRAAARRPLNSRLDCSRLADRFAITMPDWKFDLAAQFAEIAAAVQT